MELWIIRHGDPDYVHDSLTEKGIREAELLAERLSKYNIKAFYCSPLGRAQKTASYTLKKMGRTAETLPWAREFEGTVREGIKKTCCWDRKPDYWSRIDDYYDYDKWIDVDLMKKNKVKKYLDKVYSGIDELLEKHGYVKNGRIYDAVNSNHDIVVLFCHFGVEAVILSRIFSISPMIMWHNFRALPTSVTRLVTEEREQGKAIFACLQYGDLSHLYAGDEPPSFQARFCECYDDDTRH